MKNALKVLSGCALLLAVAVVSVSHEPVAEASPSVAVTMVDMAGNEIPGAIPPRVVLDLTQGVPQSTEWYLLKSFYGTEFSKRKVAASGYVDAGFSDTTGTVFTLDIPAKPKDHPCAGGLAYETEDVLVKIGSVLTFGAPDAGASTVQLDVGIAGSTERFAKDVDMLAAVNTRVLGSATTSVKPRLVDPIQNAYRLTFTQSAKDLTTATGGRIDIYVKCGKVPERP